MGEVAVSAERVAETVGVPRMWLDSGGLCWTEPGYAAALSREGGRHAVGVDLDLSDFQTAVGLARRLDLWEKARDPRWPRGLSWVDRYSACVAGSDAIVVYQYRAMVRRIDHIAGLKK